MKYSFFSCIVSALLALCLALPSTALAANGPMDHNSDGNVDILDVVQVLYCATAVGPCTTAGNTSGPTCNWATQTWNGSACVSLVIDPTTVCTAGQLYDIANASVSTRSKRG